MGQAGAQREPSMEEILASIRRIIENNEPEEGENPTKFDDTGNFDDVDKLDDAGDQDPDHADMSGDAAAEPVNPAAVVASETAPEPLSLAAVAARARLVGQSPVGEETTVSEKTTAGSDAEEIDSVTGDLTDMDDAAAEELRDALTSDEPVEAPVETRMDSFAAKHEQPDASHSKPAAAPVAPTQQPEGAGQLVSLHTGEKVAAAFGELDAAIAAGQRRSFDEIAEEMLRPMLTQWLDDNLPTLVERLVREEIERVSRGNRG